MPKRGKPQKHKVSRFRIRAERKPEPDWDRFAWALLQYSKRLVQEQEARK